MTCYMETGRILGLPIGVQQELFTYFAKVVARLELNARRLGKIDGRSMVDISGSNITVQNRKKLDVAVGAGETYNHA